MPELTIGAIQTFCAPLFFLFGLWMSYQTEGGAIGQVPVLVYAVAPPLLAVIGLGFMDRGLGWPGWPWWAYALVWLAMIYPAGAAINRAGDWGERRHRAEGDDHEPADRGS